MTTKKFLLIDGIGAIVSSVFLGLVLPAIVQYIGLPVDVLKFLASIAVMFAVYSLSTHWLVKSGHSKFLIIIAIANLLYCGLTLGVMILYIDEITLWGLLYFIGEILLILGLVSMEFKTVRAAVN